MAMMKHMAAAVLYAVVGLLSPADPNFSPLDIDGGDDDAGVECVSYVPDAKHQTSSLVLAAASRLCGQQIDGAWVIRHHHRPSAAAAVHQTPDHIAMIDLVTDRGEAVIDENATLLTSALDLCRDQDALKVVVRVQGMELGDVRRLAEERGYRFSRAADQSDAAEIEFYTDLYWSEASAPV